MACEVHVTQRPPEFDLELTPELVEAIEREAKKAGLSFNAYFKKVLLRTYKELSE